MARTRRDACQSRPEPWRPGAISATSKALRIVVAPKTACMCNLKSTQSQANLISNTCTPTSLSPRLASRILTCACSQPSPLLPICILFLYGWFSVAVRPGSRISTPRTLPIPASGTLDDHDTTGHDATPQPCLLGHPYPRRPVHDHGRRRSA